MAKATKRRVREGSSVISNATTKIPQIKSQGKPRTLPDLPAELLLQIAGLVIDRTDYWHNMQDFLRHRLICKTFEPFISSIILNRSTVVVQPPSWSRAYQFLAIVKRDQVGQLVRSVAFASGEHAPLSWTVPSDSRTSANLCDAILLATGNLVSLAVRFRHSVPCPGQCVRQQSVTSLDIVFQDISSLFNWLSACPNLSAITVDFDFDDSGCRGEKGHRNLWAEDKAYLAHLIEVRKSQEILETVSGISKVTFYSALATPAIQLLRLLPWQPTTLTLGFRQHACRGWKRLGPFLGTDGRFFRRMHRMDFGFRVKWDEQQRQSMDDIRDWSSELPHLAEIERNFFTEEEDARLNAFSTYDFLSGLNAGSSRL